MILSTYERMIARRYLLPGKGEAFIFLVASISLVAVMFGVAPLVIVRTVINGVRAKLFEKIVDLNGHALMQFDPTHPIDLRMCLCEAKSTPNIN